MKDQATFIGTGASLGVPVIGCTCPVCTSGDAKNNRLRSSLFLEYQGKKVIIDAGPDVREQALRAKISELDGVIFTHAHHDHSGGLDDLRVFAFRNKAPLPCLVSKESGEDLKKRFYFMFRSHPHEPQAGERIVFQELDSLVGESVFLGIPVRYFTYQQIGMQVLGLRIHNFAYVTDIKEYDDSLFEHLKGVDTLVLSALRFTHSTMHLTVDEAVQIAKEVGAQQTYFTHLSHDLDYVKTNALLPKGIELAYDGLQISI